MDKIMDKLTDNIILFRNLVSEIDKFSGNKTEVCEACSS